MPGKLLVNGRWVEILAMFKDAEQNVHTCLLLDGTFRGLDGILTTNPEILKIVPPPYATAAMAQAAPPTPQTFPQPSQTGHGVVCPVCGKTFKTRFGLGGHLRSHPVAVP